MLKFLKKCTFNNKLIILCFGTLFTLSLIFSSGCTGPGIQKTASITPEEIKENEKLTIILLGPPAGGKGTIGRNLSNTYGIPTLSVGQMLRDSTQKKGTLPENQKRTLRKLLTEGKLAPNKLANDAVIHRTKQEDCFYGFILDGSPRTVEQAKELNKILFKKEKGLDNHVVVTVLKIDEKELLSRLANRIDCANYSEGKLKLTKDEIRIKGCTGKEKMRPEDSVEILKKRITIYNKQTTPVVKYFEDNKKDNKVDVVYVDSTHMNIEEANRTVLNTLENVRSKHRHAIFSR
jgi:adenylate kinase